MYLETVLEDYLLELNLRNYSDRTIKSVGNTNKLYFKWLQSEFGINEIDQIKKLHIKAYLKYKQETDVWLLCYLIQVIRYLVSLRYIDDERFCVCNTFVTSIGVKCERQRHVNWFNSKGSYKAVTKNDEKYNFFT